MRSKHNYNSGANYLLLSTSKVKSFCLRRGFAEATPFVRVESAVILDGACIQRVLKGAQRVTFHQELQLLPRDLRGGSGYRALEMRTNWPVRTAETKNGLLVKIGFCFSVKRPSSYDDVGKNAPHSWSQFRP